MRRSEASPATIAAMRAAMAHRGPDAQGEFFRPQWGLGLGHVRLSIIDLAGGDQPLSNEDGTVWTVFNGEFYNFKELRARLEAAGHVFRTRSDTEVLVHLYEEKGEHLVDDLLGDFAFAIWDDRDGSLLLARDHLGVKPLYYCDYDGQLAFASTLPALLEGTDAPREFEPLALLSYLTFYVVQAPLTIYRAARKLPPGHVLTVRGGQVRLRPYWDLRMEPDDSRALDSFAEELEALVLDAVRRQMVADVPLGAFLSGGVDSSLVVRAMTECSAGPVKTFSIGYREPAYDESHFYRLLAHELNVEHHELVFQPRLLEDVTHIVSMFGEPCAIGSAFPLYYLAKLARERVTVALSGDGPDEIFAGYDLRYRYLQRMHRARRVLPRLALVGAGAVLSTTRVLRTTGRVGNLLRQLRKFCETAALPPEHWQPHLTMNRTLRTSPAALMAESVDPGRVLPYVRAFVGQAGRGDWRRPFLYADTRVVLPDEMFTKLDCMTMANGLEGRVPLCDYRIAELAARMPNEYKFDGRVGKVVLRRIAARRLPAQILQRSKVGFRVPLNEWFRNELYPLACDLLLDSSFRSSGLFNARSVAELLRAHRSGHEKFGNVIWCLVAFELWRRAARRSKPHADPRRFAAPADTSVRDCAEEG